MRGLILTEQQECQVLVAYCAVKKIRLVHVPNGMASTAKEGARMKKMGLAKGFPDYFLPYMRSGFGGMFVEMKRKCGGYPSIVQTEWIAYLNEAGYKAHICLGAQNAIDEIERYLGDF